VWAFDHPACCGSFGVTIVDRGASWPVVFGGGLIQTAVGRVSGRGGPTGSTVIVRGVTPIKGGTDYSLYRLTMAGYLLGVGLPGLALDAQRCIVVIDDLDRDEVDHLRNQRDRPVFVVDVCSTILSSNHLSLNSQDRVITYLTDHA